MDAHIAADLVVVLHFGFILFVVFGGLATLRWRWLAYLHVPAVVWGALVEFTGRLCPLTPLEQELRRMAGQTGYQGGFIQQYLLPVIYPAELTRPMQIGMGVFVVLLNVVIYYHVLSRSRKAGPHPR